METEKERLIRDIREFVGPNGYVAFEHGYRPTFNAAGVSDKQVDLRFAIGREHRRKIELEEMDEPMLIKIILELFRYYNYCHLYA